MQKAFGKVTVIGTLAAACVLIGTNLARADTWRGTAPFCDGKCRAGEQQIATSNSGNGGDCWTGHKVLCRNMQDLCNPEPIETWCSVFALVCDNKCSQWICGGCIFN